MIQEKGYDPGPFTHYDGLNIIEVSGATLPN